MSENAEDRLSKEIRHRLDRLGAQLFIHGGELSDVKFSMSLRDAERPLGAIFVDGRLPDELLSAAVAKELEHLESEEPQLEFQDFQKMLESLEDSESRDINVNMAGIITPEKGVSGGTLVVAHAVVFDALVQEILRNWRLAYEISSRKWEEIIAGAFDRSGFDEVILTPGSGDFGRDVIAIKNGVGCIKVLSSVKAYKPKLLVGYDDIRALLGVMSGERDTSKGIMVTTSDFPPNVLKDPNIAPFVPTRLELINGERLRAWLGQIVGQVSQRPR